MKVSAVLADYGFNTIRLSDDWEGADFLAVHKDGESFLKVQLKGKAFSLAKKYVGKNIWMCFQHKDGDWYLYPHDEVMKKLAEYSRFQHTRSWKEHGYIRNSSPSVRDMKMLSPYKI